MEYLHITRVRLWSVQSFPEQESYIPKARLKMIDGSERQVEEEEELPKQQPKVGLSRN